MEGAEYSTPEKIISLHLLLINNPDQMRVQRNILAVIVTGIILLSGCSNELKNDTDKIGDAMCRNIEIMGKLRTVNLNDTANISKLQEEEAKVQEEMKVLYQDFNKKYGDKIHDKEFSKKFYKELRRTMLDNCKSLSKEDRDLFEKDLEK
jgi:hypothetical protein